ncbi:MAG: hypothetical protein KC587_18730, partial [Nitrospira sp.]|nr:hypothetical protein [Nitrospira sp.]
MAKTILAVAWPFGCPARFTDTGGGQTRLAQTVPAFFPVPVARLGHATRPGDHKGVERSSFRPAGRGRTTEETPFVLQRQSFHSHITPTLLLTYKGEGEFRTFYWVGGRVVTSYVKLLLALAGPA